MKFQLSKLSNFQQRVLIGLPGAALIIWGLCVSEWFYFLLFFIICSFSLIEYFKLIKSNGFTPQSEVPIFTGIFCYVITYFVEKQLLPSNTYFIIFPLFALIFLIVLYRVKDSKPFINIAISILGIIYVGLPFALLNFCVFFSGKYHFELSLGIILLIWASDTGAYFSGKSFGKRKLFERISPKKTWEGSIGGAIITVLVSLGLAYYFPVLFTWQWVVLALIIIVAGTYGDLIESLFKRSIAIKDSGSMLLGHGGFLDRFDGLLIAVPFIAAFLRIFL